MEYLNFTPHPIVLNDGRSFESCGVARVAASFTDFDGDICRQQFGAVEGLPEQQDGVLLIVSAMVLAASDRLDLVAPATGHPMTARNERGHIVSVPGFIGK